VNIRPTRIEDIDLLLAIEDSAGESFRDIPDLAWVADDDAMSTEMHLQYVLQGTSWVAEVDDQLIGFVCAESADSNLHICELAVRREWQHQGIGRRLMKATIEHARGNQFQAVTLTTFKEIPWNEPFYRSLGFEIIDQEKLNARLEQILHAEIQHGFPSSLRCAMRLLIATDHEKNA